MQVFTIYKTTNIVNGKVYIGSHITRNPDDDYLGSGKYLKQAIAKHGRNNFTKEVLFIFDNKDEMNTKERELVTEAFIKRHDTYNASIGGSGGGNVHLTNKTSRYQEMIDKIRKSNTGKIRSVEYKELHRKLRTGTPNPVNSIKLAQQWRVIHPNGSVEDITNLTKYCKEHGLSRSCMLRVASGERAHHKHYTVRKL